VSDCKPLYGDGDIKREQAAAPRPEDSSSEHRSGWRRDYGRLIHCPAFRRLQGKTQLFPGTDHDFFRNRLTHSIEVAQIAKGIAERLNFVHAAFQTAQRANDPAGFIALDLVEFASLAHDLGHPPFGHTGEQALDECMRQCGGFEGNAQTLRILARLEKKRTTSWPPREFDDDDCRRGLNLTFPSLASVLKYDNQIPFSRPKTDSVRKGYYASEHGLVGDIKKYVLGGADPPKAFKTIECSIMDVADDIAYSTYDFEDALKAGFISLIDLLNLRNNRELLGRVTVKVWKALKSNRDPWVYGSNPDEWADKLPEQWKVELEATSNDIIAALRRLCADLLPPAEADKVSGAPSTPPAKDEPSSDKTEATIEAITRAYTTSQDTSRSGYLRTDLTSQLVNEFINGTNIEYDAESPALSQCVVAGPQKLKIETLKHLTYELHILSTRLKVVEHRGNEIVSTLFNCLSHNDGDMLLPDDWRSVASFYRRRSDEAGRRRAICDYIAGMTDRYALELYARLTSELPQTIFAMR